MLFSLLSILLFVSVAQAAVQYLKWAGIPPNTGYGLLAMYRPGGRFDIPGATYENGELPTIVGGTSIYWVATWGFTEGQPGQIRISSFGDFCLDAGLDPKNGTPLKLWQCYNNHAPQVFLFAEGKIKHVSSGLCVDVTDGRVGGTVQLWECCEGNPNQKFEIPTDPWKWYMDN